MKKRALFYCQSVLGIGHFIRSRELVLALKEFDVCFLYGGEIVPGFELPAWAETVHLPALKSDETFGALHVVDGALGLEEMQAHRKALLLSTFDRFRPDALIIELFPFGRRKFSFELLPLVEHARATHPDTKVVCSLRDILVSKRHQARYETEVCALMNQYFDLLLIHSDPQWQRLEETFASVREINCPIRYTGYVARSFQSECEVDAMNEASTLPLILISLGGGRVGHELIESALAAEKSLTSPHHLHIITGPHIPEDIFQRLEEQAALCPTVTVERHTTRFLAWLKRADLSISLAGYNTCIDILSTGVRALVYPFTGHGNDEQTLRARKLEQLGVVSVLDSERLGPTVLATEIDRCLALPRTALVHSIDMQGAEKTAQLLTDLLEEKSS